MQRGGFQIVACVVAAASNRAHAQSVPDQGAEGEKSEQVVGGRSAYLTAFETKLPLIEKELERIVAFQFHGYFRAGAGENGESGNQVCFKDPGAPVKYRFGNECDDYAELLFNYDAYRPDPNGTYFRVNTRLAFDGGSLVSFQDAQLFAPELYVEAGKFPVEGPFEKATYWAGKRFYRQDQVYIDDFYFWDMSGPGAGIENVDISIGKLALAYGRTGDTRSDKFTVEAVNPDGTMSPVKVPGMTPLEGNRIASKFQLHLSELSTPDGGTLDLALEGRVLGGERDGVGSTWGIAAYGMHTQKMLGGFNQAIFQVGEGLAADLGINSDFKASSHARTYRVMDWVVLQPCPYFTAGAVAIYQRATGTQAFPEHWLSIGARPIFNVTDRIHITLEVGSDWVDPRDGGGTRRLTKVTLGPELAVGKAFFDRPVLRIFGTYANWNGAAANNGVVLSDSDTSPFETHHYGFTAGVQSEAWW